MGGQAASNVVEIAACSYSWLRSVYSDLFNWFACMFGKNVLEKVLGGGLGISGNKGLLLPQYNGFQWSCGKRLFFFLVWQSLDCYLDVNYVYYTLSRSRRIKNSGHTYNSRTMMRRTASFSSLSSKLNFENRTIIKEDMSKNVKQGQIWV